MVYRPSTKLMIWTNQAPVPHHVVSDCEQKSTPNNIPKNKICKKLLDTWTSQEIWLGRQAYILDIGKHPLLHSYLDGSYKNSCNKLHYGEPVSWNALNVGGLSSNTHPKMSHEAKPWYNAPTWNSAKTMLLVEVSALNIPWSPYLQLDYRVTMTPQ